MTMRQRCTGFRWLATLIALLVAQGSLLSVARAANDETAPRRTVAVLEYRAGAQGAADIAERLATRLEQAAALSVLGPQAVRRRIGVQIDADVARCGGEARCIASLGARIEVDEVLLVGVSQLGDTVLALQRIDVQRAQSASRMAASIPAEEVVSDEQLLTWLQTLFPAEVFRRFGALHVIANLDGAQITIDGQVRGKTPLHEAIAVPAASGHVVLVKKLGYAPFRARIDVPPDGSIEVRAELVAETTPQPWFKRWYVWAAIGGAIAVAGAGVAIYYGTRVDETPRGFIQIPR